MSATNLPLNDIEEASQLWKEGHIERAKQLLTAIAPRFEALTFLPPHLEQYVRFNMDKIKPEGRSVVFVNCAETSLSPEIIEGAQSSAGSEEALLRMSRELVKLGYRVTVLCGIDPHSGHTLSSANPRFLPMKTIKSFTEPVDYCIAWRRTDFWRLSEYFHAPVIYAPHDWYSGGFDTGRLSGVCWLTQHQKDAYVSAKPELHSVPSVITGNGVDFGELNPQAERDPSLCGFFSAYHRGLLGVLESWSEIREAHPDAKLEIYYGRQGWGLNTEQEMAKIIPLIESLKEHGVTEKGRVSHKQLAEAMSRTSLMVNTSKFQETYGIVHAKSAAAGVILVGTDVIDPSLLPAEIELLNHNDPQLKNNFIKLVIQRLGEAKTGQLEELREKCKQHARDHLGWDRSAKRMADFLESLPAVNYKFGGSE